MTRTLPDGTEVTFPAHLADAVVGVDEDGDLVASADWAVPGETEFLYPLTPCCHATGKGMDSGLDDDFGGVGCRNCYQWVDPKYGGFVTPEQVTRWL